MVSSEFFAQDMYRALLKSLGILGDYNPLNTQCYRAYIGISPGYIPAYPLI